MTKVKKAFLDTLPLGVFIICNLLIQFSFYMLYAKSQLVIVRSQPLVIDWTLYVTWGYLLMLSFAGILLVAGFFWHMFIRHEKLTKGLYGLIIGLELLILIFLYVDKTVYELMGVHLDSYFIWNSLASGGLFREAHIKITSILIPLGAFTVLGIGFYFLLKLCFLVQKWQTKAQGILGSVGLAILLISGGITFFLCRTSLSEVKIKSNPIVEALPLFTLFDGENKINQGSLVHKYPKIPKKKLPTITRKKNMVFILAESFRSDMMVPKRTPNLINFIKKNKCIQSKHHFSGANTTSWGTFTSLYGLNGYNYLPFHKNNVPSLPLQILKKNGYQVAGFSAEKFMGWDHIDFVLKQFKPYQEFAANEGYHKDLKMLERVEKFLKTRDKSKPYFIFIFLYSTHHNYYYTPKFEKHKPAMAEDFDYFMTEHQLKKHRNKIRNRYYNSVGFVDHLFSRITKIFKEDLDKDNLITVFSGDHGEELWDHGLLGHGAFRCMDPRTRVPLLYCMPGIQSKTVKLSSHTDILPTMLDYMKLKPQLPLRRFFDGRSLLRKQSKDRQVVVVSPGFPFSSHKMCVINQKHKISLKRHGDYNQFKVTKVRDLKDKTIPKKDVKNLKQELKRLGLQMRKFIRIRNAVSRKAPKIQFPVDAQIGPYVKLVGYNLRYEKLAPGSTLQVIYTFKVLKEIPKIWNFFFHYQQSGPYKFLNADHDLVEGSYPSHRWKVGEYVQDSHLIMIPTFFPQSQRIQLWLGMWAKKRGRQPIKLGKYKFPVKKKRIQIFDIKMTP